MIFRAAKPVNFIGSNEPCLGGRNGFQVPSIEAVVSHMCKKYCHRTKRKRAVIDKKQIALILKQPHDRFFRISQESAIWERFSCIENQFRQRCGIGTFGHRAAFQIGLSPELQSGSGSS